MLRVPRFLHVLPATVLLVGCMAIDTAAQGTASPIRPTSHDLPPTRALEEQRRSEYQCGLRPYRDGRQDLSWRVRDAALDVGDIVEATQLPALLTAAWRGPLRLNRLLIAGDVPTVRFERWAPDREGPVEETWTRAEVVNADGRVLSVFHVEWPPEIVSVWMRHAMRGLDRGAISVGRYLGPEGGATRPTWIWVRIAPSALPSTDVIAVSDSIQYASHVVNLRMPSFAAGRASNTKGFDLKGAAQRFYDAFRDEYDILSFIPEDLYPNRDYQAYHSLVKNAVTGVGLGLFDESRAYGSNGVLLGAELFLAGAFASNDSSNHELNHTWGHFFDWPRILGVERAYEPHTPLMTGGESFVSALLDPQWRVGGPDDAPAIEYTPIYARQHPLDLYSAGVLPAVDVPPLRYLTNQQQLADRTLVNGLPLEPAARTLTIDDIVRAHGPRTGPVYRQFRRATVVVTRDRLLSPEEMAYWNLVAARQEDPNRSGMFDYLGLPSFIYTTNHQITLTTAVRPRAGEPAASPGDVDFPGIAQAECSGVLFDQPLPTRIYIGERVRISGRVTATDRSDFNQVLIRFWKSRGSSEQAVRAWTDVSRGGQFRLEFEFRDGQDGMYALESFLFWRDSGPQNARCILTPIRVMPPPAFASAASSRRP